MKCIRIEDGENCQRCAAMHTECVIQNTVQKMKDRPKERQEVSSDR